MDPTAERVQPPAFEDGLGRRYTIDAGGESLEVLTVRHELAAAPSFEFAVRERTTRLAAFLRACYGHVRSVERVAAEAPTLAVVSERIDGIRLSRILAAAERHRIPLDIDAALCLVRQLVQAVSLLHEHAPDVSHGAVAPERLVVTPHARLVVTDFVFGAALAELEYSRERYWQELQVALPPGTGAPRLDRRADVAQVGAVALAAILGRRLRHDEYPSRISEMIERADALTIDGREPLSADLRGWLSKALQLDARDSFGSAIEAGVELETVLSAGDHTAAPEALRAFLERCAPFSNDETLDAWIAPPAHSADHALAVSEEAPAPVPAPRPLRLLIPSPAALSPAAAPSSPADVSNPERRPHAPADDEPATGGALHADTSVLAFDRSPVPQDVNLSGSDIVPAATDASAPRLPSAWSPRWLISAAVALITLTSGVTLATRQYFTPRVEANQPGTLTVNTSTAGVLVVIDGFSRGRTPLTTDLSPGEHVLELVTDAGRRTIPLSIPPGGNVSQFVEVAAPAVNTGKVFVRTEPAGARVSVDGQYFGSSPITVDGLSPGVHTVEVGDRSSAVTERVTIEAGATAALVVPLSGTGAASGPGWIAVRTPVEVQLYEKGTLVGSSRSSRIMVPAGRHELELVNEPLGYKAAQSVVVAPGSVATVRPRWPVGTLAVNALPWAEVRIDGQRIGETPIGGVELPIGPHEVVFRHPQLGEHRHQIVVTLKEPARLSVDLRKK